jgi:hypothetical protein
MSRALEVSGRSEDRRHVDILTGKVVDFREMVDELSISDCLVELYSLHVVALLLLLTASFLTTFFLPKPGQFLPSNDRGLDETDKQSQAVTLLGLMPQRGTFN